MLLRISWPLKSVGSGKIPDVIFSFFLSKSLQYIMNAFIVNSWYVYMTDTNSFYILFSS